MAGRVLEGVRGERLAGLDLLRSVAIVCVVAFHLQGFLPEQMTVFGRLGWMGVDLFFVLSGYLIGWQLLREGARGDGLKVVEFYRRRAYRILPAYLVVVLLYELVPVWRERPVIAATWKFVTFSYNLTMRYPAELAFSHAWSLCIEEHFYLVLPLMIWWLMQRPSARKTALVFAGVLAWGVLVRWWELTHVVRVAGEDEGWVLLMRRIYYPTYSRLDGLAAGVALAAVRAFRPRWWQWLERSGWATLAGGVALVGLACWSFRFQYPAADDAVGLVLGFPLLAYGFALLVASGMARNGALRVRVPGTETLATLAFSLYLTHKAVAHLDQVAFEWMDDNRGWAAAAVYAVSCLAMAALLYVVVERPFLRLRELRGGLAVSVEARVDPAV